MYNKEYNWIYQIISNKENGIDIDKIDSIQRDIYHSGIKASSVNYDEIFRDVKIINDKICFNDKNDINLINLIQQ